MEEAGLWLGWIRGGRIGPRLDWGPARLGVGRLGLGLIGAWVHWAGWTHRRMKVGRAGCRWLIDADASEFWRFMGDARARGARISTTGEHRVV